MNSLSFDVMPGFSQLFRDFCCSTKAILERFPSNALLYTNTAHWKTIAADNPSRNRIIAAIEDTMNGLTFSPEQRENLRKLALPTTLTTITGQQVGLLGGHHYTMLKAWTAIQTARKLTANHAGLEFVPIFWIADNDHDVAETSVVSLLDVEGHAVEVCLNWDAMPERVAVSDVRFDAGITAVLEHIKALLPETAHTDEILSLLEETYVAGASPTQAFVQLLQMLLAGSGILLVNASALQRQGLFADIACKELEHPELSEQALQTASSKLLERGYHVQAHSTPVNIFLHTDGKRLKINRTEEGRFQAGEITYSQAELLDYVRSHPEAFTPNVFLRPVAQDMIFPNACYIGGPGEVSYLAQMTELYAVYGIVPAAVVARHSATFLEYRVEQFFEHQQNSDSAFTMSPERFMQPFQDVEKEIMAQLADKGVAEALVSARAAQEELHERLGILIAALDETLEATVDKTKTRTLQSLDDLARRVRRAEKRREEITLVRAWKVHSLLYPMNALQERSLTILYFVNKYGVADVSKALEALTAEDNDKHYLVPLA